MPMLIKKFRKRTILVFLSVIIILCACTGYYYFNKYRIAIEFRKIYSLENLQNVDNATDFLSILGNIRLTQSYSVSDKERFYLISLLIEDFKNKHPDEFTQAEQKISEWEYGFCRDWIEEIHTNYSSNCKNMPYSERKICRAIEEMK